jgi:crossover junction endodeoxyribonuclease RuvC
MIVLGVDPGSRATGYGLVEFSGNRLRHVAHGVIKVGGEESMPARLAEIFNELTRVMTDFSPVEAGVETIFSAKNVQSAFKLGQARGVILLAAELRGIPVAEYSPTQVKNAVVGYGRAEKEQVQEMVRRFLALPKAAPSDASDALAVAICHGRTRSTLDAMKRIAR